MAEIGFLILAISIVVVIVGAYKKYQAGKLASAPFVSTGDASSGTGAGEKGAISAYGDVKCEQLLISPVTKTECIYYELKVVGSWKEGDSSKSKDYVAEKISAAIQIDDGSGPVLINAGNGGDFEGLEKTFDETKQEGLFADLKSAVGKGEPMMFGEYPFENPPMSKADKFQCTEKVLKASPKMFASGKFADGVITTPDGMLGALMLSPKSRDELLGDTEAQAKKLLKFGGIGAGVGLLIAIISLVIG
ncbi:MAG: hypothetical protein GY913_31490 [Proteobacteria bacterium]|nr:hypothetical protein [Pseudomonadota bacterium]